MKTALILFAYCKTITLEKTLKSLSRNNLEGLDFYAFVDYKDSYTQWFIENIILSSKIPFRITLRNKRYGLNKNIIEGMKQVFNMGYDAIIVLEDDLILDKDAVEYVINNLEKYKDNSTIQAVSAYSHTYSFKKGETLYPGFLCYFYGTWKDSFIFKVDYKDELTQAQNIDLYFTDNGLKTVHPFKSKVKHIGWTGEHFSLLNIISPRRILRKLGIIKYKRITLIEYDCDYCKYFPCRSNNGYGSLENKIKFGKCSDLPRNYNKD